MEKIQLTKQELISVNGGSELSESVVRFFGYVYEMAKDIYKHGPTTADFAENGMHNSM